MVISPRQKTEFDMRRILIIRRENETVKEYFGQMMG